MSEWISVKDRLPEHGKTVWVYDTFDKPTLGWFSESSCCWYGDLDEDEENPLNITHWMQANIPKKPEDV